MAFVHFYQCVCQLFFVSLHMMRHLLTSMLLALCSTGLWAQNEDVALIPCPRQVEWGLGQATLADGLTISVSHPSLRNVGQYLCDILKADYGLRAQVAEGGAGQIRLTLGASGTEASAEGAYKLACGARGIDIVAPHAAGVVNGVATLRQMLPGPDAHGQGVKGVPVPYAQVTDAPRYGWRGLMIDCSRHFCSTADIKRLLQIMAFYKLNKLHWHLTDDQGWRVEIKKYPLLTQKGAWRHLNDQDRWCVATARRTDNADLLLDPSHLRVNGTDTLYGGFYTQQQVRDIVAYASARGIEVIPEIDMPGHSLSAIDSYPWLGCGADDSWRGFSSPLCLGNDRVLRFCRDVWTELFQLFPSTYVHIGGDEVAMTFWRQCPRCQKRMRKRHLADGHALQAWFIGEMQRFFTAHGRRMIGWDEILDGGQTLPGATVMWWRGNNAEGAVRAANSGHDVIVCPTTHFYYDYAENDGDVERIFQYTPPKGLGEEGRAHVLGLQANLWAEHIPTFSRLLYMALPRMLAQAEAAWAPGQSSLADFQHRLSAHYRRLAEMGASYRLPGITGVYQRNVFFPEQPASCLARVHCADTTATIRYTTDGQVPDTLSAVYTAPIPLAAPTLLRFRAFGRGGVKGDVADARFCPATWMEAVPVRQHALRPGLVASWYDYAGGSCADIEKAPLRGTYDVAQVGIPDEVKGNIGLVLRGYLYIPADAAYGFVLISDDGSVLDIDGQRVVDNDGEHATIVRSAQVALRKGYHSIEVRYFDHNGGCLSLDVVDAEGCVVPHTGLFYK